MVKVATELEASFLKKKRAKSHKIKQYLQNFVLKKKFGKLKLSFFSLHVLSNVTGLNNLDL